MSKTHRAIQNKTDGQGHTWNVGRHQSKKDRSNRTKAAYISGLEHRYEIAVMSEDFRTADRQAKAHIRWAKRANLDTE